MKFQQSSESSSGGPSGPTLLMEGCRAHPDQPHLPKGKVNDYLNHEPRGALPSETLWSHTPVDWSVVLEAGALARKSVFRRVAVVVISVDVVSTFCGGSN